ncbi:MAG: alpha/beta fold hydrolase, partial [Proteobacteria bacterium]|nr:alpha/beta fold hydrolase [Pseudomonadota bacterium]
MNRAWLGFASGWAIILIGAVIAHLVQTSDGISVRDVRFAGGEGKTLSALLYVPASATAQTRAPGILAVHGYINSRETQSGFAIEFARRGYVVLALDQTGHGYSDPPAFSDGFGGPAGLTYLRSLEMVDTDNIGLEGHSMGGWTVLAAAAAMPDAYTSIVLEGSSTGPPFAGDGSPTWPRNLSVVFSRYDEFAGLMWGVERAAEVGSSAKLQALFGTTETVIENQIYGSLANGTARALKQPAVTHPGDHISHAAIGHALDWFAQTLKGGRSLTNDDQIWFIKEIGTLLALIGLVVLMAGSFNLLLKLPYFSRLANSHTAAYPSRNRRWWLLGAVMATVPVATFYLFFQWAAVLLPPSAWLPQGITNQVAFWALLNGLIIYLIGKLTNQSAPRERQLVPSALIALATIAIAYVAVELMGLLFLVDFRFWIVGLKALSSHQAQTALVYLIPFIAYFYLALRGLHNGMSVKNDSPLKAYTSNAFIMAGGFLIFLLAQYTTLFTTGTLLTPTEPLNTIVMIQFVPLLLIISILTTFTYRRTATPLPGILINALLITWYIV